MCGASLICAPGADSRQFPAHKVASVRQQQPTRVVVGPGDVALPLAAAEKTGWSRLTGRCAARRRTPRWEG